MTALAASIVTAVVAAVLAAVGTYFTTRRNLEAAFDTSLRDLRIDAYQKLWQNLEPLAKYDRPEALTQDEARKLAGTLRTWYFETGGIFLSHRTRQDYFALLDGLETFTAAGAEPLDEEDDEFLRVLGSRLRTGMTADVGTRRSFPFEERGRRRPTRSSAPTPSRAERAAWLSPGGLGASCCSALTSSRSASRASRSARAGTPSDGLSRQEPPEGCRSTSASSYSRGPRSSRARRAGSAARRRPAAGAPSGASVSPTPDRS
jgi:hypothetical protein